MITDLCVDGAGVPILPGLAARASASSSSGRPSPPMTNPPILRNDRRDTPSQYVPREPGAHSVNMVWTLRLGYSPYLLYQFISSCAGYPQNTFGKKVQQQCNIRSHRKQGSMCVLSTQ